MQNEPRLVVARAKRIVIKLEPIADKSRKVGFSSVMDRSLQERFSGLNSAKSWNLLSRVV